MGREFAIGDIHGCSVTFRKLLLDILQADVNDRIICVGDYIDRGPDSKGVVDLIVDLREKGYQIETIRGNHEHMMMESTRDEMHFWLWMANGGEATLKSFGISSYDEMPSVYKDFFSATGYFHTRGNYIFTHAGLNFNAEDPFTDTNSMLWIRGFEADNQWLNGRTLIHGHTPLSMHYLERQTGPVINIDGGCVYKPFGKYGYLVAYDLQQRKFISAEYCD